MSSLSHIYQIKGFRRHTIIQVVGLPNKKPSNRQSFTKTLNGSTEYVVGYGNPRKMIYLGRAMQ